MPQIHPEPPAPGADAEYRAIERALLETPRGRWFLAEHGRRSRRLDTDQIESALTQLKTSLRDPPAVLGRLEGEMEALAQLCAETRKSILERERRKPAPAGARPAREPDAAVPGLLKAAEDLHALTWSLQSRDVDPETCLEIGRQTARIFALGAAQAEESRRAVACAEALEAVEKRAADILAVIRLEAARDVLPEAPPAGD